MMMVVDLFTHRPVASWYTPESTANDKQWLDELIDRLPSGGLLVFDLGFFKFPWFDQFTTSGKYFVTRQREKTSYTLQKVFSSGSHYRDEQIQMGQYRSSPCKHPVRMVSVLWGTTWYSYLTNVLDPTQLSAQQVCDLYRRRWRIEDAFALTKRLLGLAYVWVGDTNGVEIQVYATWIFYALINDLCADVAIAMNQPLELISLEMVFRSLYHFNNFQRRGEATDVIDFLVTHAQLLGILKAKRPRHRLLDDWSEMVWGIPKLDPVPLS
jgi:Transposase DDE domain